MRLLELCRSGYRTDFKRENKPRQVVGGLVKRSRRPDLIVERVLLTSLVRPTAYLRKRWKSQKMGLLAQMKSVCIGAQLHIFKEPFF